LRSGSPEMRAGAVIPHRSPNYYC